jgi:hypothetical protein
VPHGYLWLRRGCRLAYPLLGAAIGGFVALALWLSGGEVSRTALIMSFAAGFTSVFILGTLEPEDQFLKRLKKREREAAKEATSALQRGRKVNTVLAAAVDLAAVISALPW